MKTILSVQAEAWLILFESQQVLACLSGSGQTYGPEMSITKVQQLQKPIPSVRIKTIKQYETTEVQLLRL